MPATLLVVAMPHETQLNCMYCTPAVYWTPWTLSDGVRGSFLQRTEAPSCPGGALLMDASGYRRPPRRPGHAATRGLGHS